MFRYTLKRLRSSYGPFAASIDYHLLVALDFFQMRRQRWLHLVSPVWVAVRVNVSRTLALHVNGYSISIC